MKMAVKGLGVAVLAVMFAFAFAGCEEDEDPPSPTPVVSTPTGTVINIAAIKGVVVPAYILTPVKEITENAQFSGTVKWNGNPSTFGKDTKYTATITLIPKTGYILQGVKADFFTVVGAESVSNAANSGVITAVFPKTEPKYVTDIKIEKQPAKLIYTHGDELSLSGLAVTLTYNDATKEENLSYVHLPLKSITTDPEDGEKLDYTKHNGKPIKIAYGKIAYSDLIYTTDNLDINTPTAEDFEISGLTQEYDGSPKTVTITRKEGKSTGTITVKYNGSTTMPSDVGTYTVTFDVAAATNFNAASGLSAGSLTIERSTPTAADFNISGLTQGYDGSRKAVDITPKEGKSTGTITVYYEGTGSTTYTKSTTASSNLGTYTVTFDVAAATNFNAASGLSAGTLSIGRSTPTAEDFDINGNGIFTYDGSSKTVTITPKGGKSDGIITVYYEGTGSTTYTKSTTAPSAVGTYTITFYVAAATGYNSASGLSAGTLTVNKSTPIVEDFNISGNGTFTYDGSSKTITIMPKGGKSTGAITVKYNESTTAPSDVGTYTLTFDVAATTNYNAVNGLSAGILTIGKSTPTAEDFNISGIGSFYYDGSSKTVTITPKGGKSDGIITVYYEGTGSTTYTKSKTAPSAVGTYNVTFDVAAVTNFNAVSGLTAGTLMNNKSTPKVADFNISGTETFTYDGNPKTVTITPKEGKSTGTITVKYNGNTTAPSVGIYTVTFDVAATTNYNAVTGLSAGTLTIKSIPIADDFNISGLTQYYDGNPKTVTITKIGISTGTITVYYEGTESTIYTKSTTAPSNVGTYTVTFDVAATTNYNAVNGLSAGTLMIIKIEMVSISAGTFTMGSPESELNRRSDETQHSVTLSSFKMSKYQVTQEQWVVVMGSYNPSRFTSSPASGEVQGKRPVEEVSWYDTLVFCNKLSIKEGLNPAYRISGSTDPAVWGTVPLNSNSTWNAVEIVADSNGYRLPTEAQWEYAARGGNGSPGNYEYSGSNNIGDVAWYWDNSDEKTHEVGKKAPNGLGLYDMNGNVFERCWDYYGEYSNEAQTDPMGAAAGSLRVLRGGGWVSDASRARSAFRSYDNAYNRSYYIGFRLIRP